MNALTLHQPWASLVAVGAKTTETRSWRPPAAAIGERLVIHASKARPNFSALPIREACYAHAIGVWEQRPNEPWGSLVCVDDTQRFVPRGAVVASCVLADVVPIVSDHDDAEGLGRYVSTTGTSAFLWHDRDKEPHTETLADFIGEVPFGDFSPGRFAWLLEDVAPTTERCPWCWGDQWTELARAALESTRRDVMLPEELDMAGLSDPGRYDLAIDNGCVVCTGRLSCDPIPASGRQRIWRWKAGT